MSQPIDQPPTGLDSMSAHLATLAWDAQLAFNRDLAAFQATGATVSDLSLLAVLEAARPAFEAGFCYLVRQDSDGVEVCLRHVGGAEEISSADAATMCSPALLLAGLLGIPVDPDVLSSEPEQHAEESAQVQPERISASASDPEPPAAAEEPDLMGPESPPDRPGNHPSLQPLTAEQVATAVAMVKAMDAAQRKSFTIAFRHAFSIDPSVLRIASEIKQIQHLEFVDRFTCEAAGTPSP